MKKIIVTLNELGFYCISNESTDKKFIFFVNFLINEEQSFKDFYLRWLNQPEYMNTVGNYYQLIKFKDDVYLSVFDDDFNYEINGNPLPTGAPHEFKISHSEFERVLEKWKKIMAMDSLPREIVVQQDDQGKINILSKP